MRIEAGAVVDEFDLPGVGRVVSRFSRNETLDDGVSWACMFTVVANGNSDLAIVHRLSAPTLREARRCMRQAVEFLLGRGAEPLTPRIDPTVALPPDRAAVSPLDRASVVPLDRGSGSPLDRGSGLPSDQVPAPLS